MTDSTAITFDDINLLPKFSTVESRSEVDTHSWVSKNIDLDVPILAAPMDTVCDLEMCLKLSSMGALGVLHRFMTIQEQAKAVTALKMTTTVNYNKSTIIAAAIGSNGDALERAEALLIAGVDLLVIDVAHGHHINVQRIIGELNDRFKHKYGFDIMAGNIATAEAARDLQEWGADSLRVGIGGGCFTPNMSVGTSIGMIPIIDIKINDYVYTHTGELKQVINKFKYHRDEEILVINGIECTKNHEFYVIHSKYENLITDENIHQYAEWISAENITDEYFLIEL